MNKVVTMGEVMLRLSPNNYKRIVQSDELAVEYGGGEANVAVSLAAFGEDAYFVTKVPSHEVGDAAINSLRRYGVNTSYIARGGERLGIYFLETGAGLRASKVIYDRKHSSISEAEVSDFDFDNIFKDCKWFHFTGITPAISKEARKLTLAALKKAKEYGVIVSCDLNYRGKLWSVEEARSTMSELMKYVDVCIGNEEDADKCLGFVPSGSNVTGGKLNLDGYKEIFKEMKQKFGFKYIATSLRESHSASDNGWSGLLYDGKEFYSSRHYEIRIVDRVGGGDSFAAGLIHCLLNGESAQTAIDFAVGASALKQTIPGDYNMVSLEEVNKLIKGDASGRVQR